MSSLIERLTIVNARLQALPDRLGVPFYEDMVLVRPDGSMELIAPRPQVKGVTPRDATGFLGSSVEIFPDDVWLVGIPRTYSEDDLKRSRFILKALPSGETWVGTKAELIWLDRSDLLSFRVLVRPFRGR
jgi:hypothetical protein